MYLLRLRAVAVVPLLLWSITTPAAIFACQLCSAAGLILPFDYCSIFATLGPRSFPERESTAPESEGVAVERKVWFNVSRRLCFGL